MLLYLFFILFLLQPQEYKAPVPDEPIVKAQKEVSCVLLAITGKNSAVTYSLEEAITEKQKLRGLMFREQVPEKSGMIFYNQEPEITNMWMKNTSFPLDMLFIDEKGEIVCIKEDAVPLTEDTISCDKPVKFVVEINGGQVKAHKISVGDRCMIIPNMKEMQYSKETGCTLLKQPGA